MISFPCITNLLMAFLEYWEIVSSGTHQHLIVLMVCSKVIWLSQSLTWEKFTQARGATCHPLFVIFFNYTIYTNAQVLYGTNCVAIYVVKYIVKLEQVICCVLWADAHSGAVTRYGQGFLYNTNISSSKYNEDKSHEKSREFHNPAGCVIAFT